MLAAEKSRRKPSKLQMTPLIDVVFLLIIFFMLTFGMQVQGLEVSLPEGQASENQDYKNLTIKIDKNQTVSVDDRVTLIKDLENKIKTELMKRNDKNVVVETHRDASYKIFTKVLDTARLAGAKEFSILK